MTDQEFKIMLIKVLECNSHKCKNFFGASLKDVVDLLPLCEVYLERTGIFSHVTWNTYKTILHIRCPMDKASILEDMRDDILVAARKIYSEKDQKLTDLEIGFLPEENEIIDFSNIANTDVIKSAISDAEVFMNKGQYDSAFDRIHTAFHGFLRSKLDDFGIDYIESESLSQLYNKLHITIEKNITPVEVAELVKTIMRSGSGVITSINEIRNRHSLVHPNDLIINRREAEFTLQMIKVITDYINRVC